MTYQDLLEEETTHSIIGAFYEVYNTLGYGFLEHIYIMALERELRDRGHTVSRQTGVLVRYKESDLGYQRLDMIVDGKVVVETKSTPKLAEAASRQLFNYLRATQLEVGLLLHFGPSARFVRLISSNEHARREISSTPARTERGESEDASAH